MEQADFMFLRPLLLNVLENPAKESVDELSSGLRNLHPQSLQTLQEYVLLPLVELLNVTPRLRFTLLDSLLMN